MHHRCLVHPCLLFGFSPLMDCYFHGALVGYIGRFTCLWISRTKEFSAPVYLNTEFMCCEGSANTWVWPYEDLWFRGGRRLRRFMLQLHKRGITAVSQSEFWKAELSNDMGIAAIINSMTLGVTTIISSINRCAFWINWLFFWKEKNNYVKLFLSGLLRIRIW